MNVQLTGESNRPEQDPDTKHGFVFEPVRDVEVWSIRRAHFLRVFFSIFVRVMQNMFISFLTWLPPSPFDADRRKEAIDAEWFFVGFFVARSEWFSVGCWGHCSEFFVFFHQRLPLSPFDDDRPKEAIDASNCSEETLLRRSEWFFIVFLWRDRSDFLLVVCVFFHAKTLLLRCRVVARSDWFFVGFLSDSLRK